MIPSVWNLKEEERRTMSTVLVLALLFDFLKLSLSIFLIVIFLLDFFMDPNLFILIFIIFFCFLSFLVSGAMDTDRSIKDRDCDSDNCQDVSVPSTIVAATDGTYSTDIFVYCSYLILELLNKSFHLTSYLLLFFQYY